MMKLTKRSRSSRLHAQQHIQQLSIGRRFKSAKVVSLILLLGALTLLNRPSIGQRRAGVQEDITGEWMATTHEDRMERRGGPAGPELGDYLGFR